MAESVIQRAFLGGELAPALGARADLAKYASGLRTCRNFLVQRHGGAQNRSGTRFVGETKNPTDPRTSLIRYVHEDAGESILIEAGPGYFRFYKEGALVRLAVPPAAWDIATPYVTGDLVRQGGVNYYCLFDSLGNVPPDALFWYPMPSDILEVPSDFNVNLPLQWSQSGRTITLTSLDLRPFELIYVALTRWIYREVQPRSLTPVPAALVLTPGGAGARRYAYIVTAAAVETYEESTGSAPIVNAACAVPTELAPNNITWGAVVGAAEYYVYCDPYNNGNFGYVGTAAANNFNDIGFVPDFAVTPPLVRALSLSFGTSATYQQRRFFGNTNPKPDAIYGSRVGFPTNFGISSPLQDDDAITFAIAGAQNNPVRHLVALKQLIVLTDGGVFSVGAPKEALSPSNLPTDQESYVGSSYVRPTVVGNTLIYLEARGSQLRDLGFDQQIEGFGGRDLTIFAGHLFDGFTIHSIDFQQNPHSIVWAVRSDGTLLGLTYIPEQDIFAWHRHDTTGGAFRDVCIVPEDDEDVAYFIVARIVGGALKFYIESLERRQIDDFNADAFFVDSGLSYVGAPITTATGLSHLEGMHVSVMADGATIHDANDPLDPAFVVTGGSVSLGGGTYSTVHVGLPIRAQLETLDLDVQGSAVRDKKKRVGGLAILLDKSDRSFFVGPDSAHLVPYALKSFETVVKEFSGQIDMNILSSFNDNGRVLIQHTAPLPFTVLGIIPSVTLGG